MTEKAINFRQTPGYVTDGTGETYYEINDNGGYPITRAGQTFGWDTVAGWNTRDRNNTLDRRLAGVHWFANDGVVKTFRLDLDETGTHDVDLAVGDAVHGGFADCEVYDNATKFIDIPGGSLFNTQEFYDASATLRSGASAWLSGRVLASRNFGSTMLLVKFNPDGNTSSTTNIAHIRATLTGGGGPAPSVGLPAAPIQFARRASGRFR